MSRITPMETIADHMLGSFEARCKEIEDLAQEFKALLEKSSRQRGERALKAEEMEDYVNKLLNQADALLNDIACERMKVAEILSAAIAKLEQKG